MNIQLSNNFTLDELITTSHKDLLQQQAEEVRPYVTNLYILANYILQPIRNYYKVPIIINSGFRGGTLNKRVGGTLTSDHTCIKGAAAADFTVKGKTVDEVFDDIISGRIGISYRQVINEKSGNARWIHIATFRLPFDKTDKYMHKLKFDGKNYIEVK
jgi:hypothetical protein